MLNASPSNPRPPSRVPRRGLAALVLTASAMVLLFSFKTPSDMFAGGATEAFVASAAAPVSETTSSAGSIGAVSDVPPGPSAPRLPIETIPPETEPPATVSPATEPPPTEPPATEPPPTAPAQQVVTGQSVRTRYGLVQVEVTLGSGSISDVQALRLPFDRLYSARVSRYVEPILREDALKVQGADINLISGATYTSKAYAMSLQSALDQAA